MELISVIMSVYNETENMVRESIESILNQTYSALEFIIVQDNPENLRAREVLYEYASRDSRVRVMENEENNGLSLSLNKALSAARGKYIARMDADDISSPERLERELKCIQEGNYDVVFTGRTNIDENGTVLASFPVYSSSSLYIREVLPYICIVNHPSAMMKTEVLRAQNGYRNFYASQDYDLWLRLLSSGCKFGCIQEPLINYRVRSSSVSVSQALIQYESMRYIKRLYKERLKYDTDSYNWDGYKRYIRKNGGGSERLRARYALSKGMGKKVLERIRKRDYSGACSALFKFLKGMRWKWYSLIMFLGEKKVERKYAGSR